MEEVVFMATNKEKIKEELDDILAEKELEEVVKEQTKNKKTLLRAKEQIER